MGASSRECPADGGTWWLLGESSLRFRVESSLEYVHHDAIRQKKWVRFKFNNHGSHVPQSNSNREVRKRASVLHTNSKLLFEAWRLGWRVNGQFSESSRSSQCKNWGSISSSPGPIIIHNICRFLSLIQIIWSIWRLFNRSISGHMLARYAWVRMSHMHTHFELLYQASQTLGQSAKLGEDSWA